MKSFFANVIKNSLVPIIGICLLYLSLMLIVIGCSDSNGPQAGTECASCEKDSDCNSGLHCGLFTGANSVAMKCAKSSTKCEMW